MPSHEHSERWTPNSSAEPQRATLTTCASSLLLAVLKHGRLTVMCKLGPRTAALALIRVSAKLDHELAVTSTLRRPVVHRKG